jgi:hypothetical protein
MTDNDRGASQDCHFRMANVGTLAVGDLQLERFEGAVIETFSYGFAEHLNSSLFQEATPQAPIPIIPHHDA